MRIVVAMSGGVDSSVAAARLVREGHEVIGVHMRLHDESPTAVPTTRRKTCCGLDDAEDARRVADTLGIPFYVWNLRDAFRKAVMDGFVGDWVAGRTPNPCIHCNGVLKFRVLLSRAKGLGAEALATGHYARIGRPDGVPTLREAVDPRKDQSYFLFPMTVQALAATRFPLGDSTKDEIRAEAAAMGLATADKPESQDVCFLPDGDHASFVERQRPGLDASGDLVDEAGTVLGHHTGFHRFTVGQRRGIGISATEPLYVLAVEPDTRRVVVGPNHRLQHHAFVADACTWTRRPSPDEVIQVRTRHLGPLVPATVEPASADGEVVSIQLQAPLRAVTPGQAAVCYDPDGHVLGGGWIRRVQEAG